MRPIDADALTDKLNERLRCCNRRSVVEACILSVIDMLDSCPTIAPPPNDPLTMEELREMGGELVWIAEEQRYAFLRDGGEDFLCVSRNRLQWDLVDAVQAGETVGGRTFYRRKPEGGDHVDR